MESLFDTVPLVFLAIALVTLVLGFAIVLDVSLAGRFGNAESGSSLPVVRDPDVALLVFWAALVFAVAVSLFVAISS